jgi:hypothetical protein
MDGDKLSQKIQTNVKIDNRLGVFAIAKRQDSLKPWRIA